MISFLPPPTHQPLYYWSEAVCATGQNQDKWCSDSDYSRSLSAHHFDSELFAIRAVCGYKIKKTKRKDKSLTNCDWTE